MKYFTAQKKPVEITEEEFQTLTKAIELLSDLKENMQYYHCEKIHSQNFQTDEYGHFEPEDDILPIEDLDRAIFIMANIKYIKGIS